MLYELQAFAVLARHFDFALDPNGSPLADHWALRSVARQWRSQPPCDVLVRDQRTIALGRPSSAPSTLGLIHHIAFSVARDDARYQLLFAALKRRLPRLSAVVTVSRYWKDLLESLGCRDVEVIYNAFDPADYVLRPGQLDEFHERFGLPRDRPLIYLGSAGPQKGGAEAWQALRDQGYTLFMTGRNPAGVPPVRTELLDRADFVALLHAAAAVVTLSTLPEGWNRVAHEAMLCGTPVVGSGAAGMRELLDGGGQMVCATGQGLAEAVRAAIARRESLGGQGRAYVQQFDLGYFERAWVRLVERLARPAGSPGGDPEPR
jgi:glycosyltransferase involved in cell wall biosynthesis